MRRHAAIATAAAERLQSTRAKETIARILDEGGDGSLGQAARWADEIRSNGGPHDPATVRFLNDSRNRARATWHYVNLPLDLGGYDRQSEFTRSDDVVQMILLAVESLRNPGPDARFEEIIALRWLSHLVGDVHQPVHVGCGYIANAETNQARLVTAPGTAVGLPSDRGGGKLLLPTGDNLHGFWDSKLGPDLVPNAIHVPSDEPLVRELVQASARATANAAVTTMAAMSVSSQVASWANASLAAARAAYQGLRITGYRQQQKDYPVEWEGEAAYRQRCAPIVSERMTTAATNLAALLDSIWP
ncbi:MAG: S1/P1 nuclease [Acidobacteriota bacterium]